MIRIPELTTERLLLRSFTQDDFEAYAAMMADPSVTRFLGPGRPLSRADAWHQIAMFAGKHLPQDLRRSRRHGSFSSSQRRNPFVLGDN
jgi:RimJ/RimL family protein N-acetyltransferase